MFKARLKEFRQLECAVMDFFPKSKFNINHPKCKQFQKKICANQSIFKIRALNRFFGAIPFEPKSVKL